MITSNTIVTKLFKLQNITFIDIVDKKRKERQLNF